MYCVKHHTYKDTDFWAMSGLCPIVANAKRLKVDL